LARAGSRCYGVRAADLEGLSQWFERPERSWRTRFCGNAAPAGMASRTLLAATSAEEASAMFGPSLPAESVCCAKRVAVVRRRPQMHAPPCAMNKAVGSPLCLTAPFDAVKSSSRHAEAGTAVRAGCDLHPNGSENRLVQAIIRRGRQRELAIGQVWPEIRLRVPCDSVFNGGGLRRNWHRK